MAEPLTLINRAEGRSLTNIAKNGLGGWIFAVFTSAITGTQELLTLLLLPIRVLVDVAWASANAFILGPLGVAVAGSETTAAEVSVFGIFALPVGTAIVLGTLAIVAFYLQWRDSSDFSRGRLPTSSASASRKTRRRRNDVASAPTGGDFRCRIARQTAAPVAASSPFPRSRSGF